MGVTEEDRAAMTAVVATVGAMAGAERAVATVVEGWWR